MELFSKNIIFVDTEFSTLDPYKGEILSLGIVKLNGESLYLELEFKGETSPWVEKHILPTLINKKVSRKKAVSVISNFVGKRKPYAVGFIPQHDTLYLYKLFGVNEHPFRWLPIDFASIMFSQEINPENYFRESFLKKIGIDTTRYKHTHNALDDAKLLREVFMKFFKIKTPSVLKDTSPLSTRGRGLKKATL
ncbi:MAG: hypothetical protein UR60_C0004G0007 [Candidatus Moranbacteria bacterium GW2011_GWF2_34_56]|nr:MAG: hypothetical protein UR51_C0010G0066 [Candidatus Moranbacteria bacterium GW2011_GWF1_34_10]KKP65278.1 MAG: hypothetical protein UR60_C0004G0007 [Candidatus Moranbacteria bacterium GW2011_GWF2_34_56]HBI16877.1 hypothetical protein [Candidatus Moranbacteria bacterium]